MKRINMKLKLFAGLFFASATMALMSCDDNTNEIGSSLINNLDKLNVQADTFTVATRSIAAGSVLSRNSTGYVGRVKDPQTGAYVTGNFMTQFHVLENFQFPEKDSIRSLSSTGEIIADSCELRLYYDNYFGDSLATMKLTAYEMNKPMEEGRFYYSNFDPEKEGYLRTNGLKKSKVYTLYDKNVSDDTRSDSRYMKNIRVKIDQPYTDKNGKTYSNYGSYVMQKYYENPKYFKDAYAFIHNVVPGFYFKNQGGLGSMAYVSISQLNVYFRLSAMVTKYDTTYVDKKPVITEKQVLDTLSRVASFAGTDEVLQATTIDNDNDNISTLVGDNGCTWLKTPAGIFTEMDIPVEKIMSGHEKDVLNSAKVVFTRLNSFSKDNYGLGIPQTLLMIPKADMYSFFEENRIADNKTAFLAAYNSSYNTYTFNNISNLVAHLASTSAEERAQNPEWNKVVIIPVTTTYNKTSTAQELTKVSHDMSLTSTKLIGGSANPYEPIKISVVYAKFKEK